MRSLLEVVKNPSGWDSLANYMGRTDFDGLDCLLTRNRDSTCLERSNFESALKLLGGEGDNVEIHHFGHWACGWWEALAVKQGTPQHKQALEIEVRLENYPVLDESHWSNLEGNEADEVWRNCFRPKDRVKYIRENRSDFEFQTFRDLMSCVRGQQFCGDSSQLVD